MIDNREDLMALFNARMNIAQAKELARHVVRENCMNHMNDIIHCLDEAYHYLKSIPYTGGLFPNTTECENTCQEKEA